jgi:putative hydrolase of the HAD superfamily
MIKSVIFDIGGVIIDFSNDDHYYPYLSKVSGVSIRRIKRLIEGGLWARLDKDEISQKELDRTVSRRLGIEEREVRWYESYEKAAKINRKVIADIRRLSKNYEIAYLSNVDLSRYTYTLRIMQPYRKLFRHEFASCYLHARKPERKIFRHVLSKMHLKASEVIFIDNMPENIKGARRAGLKAILFKNSRGMEADLRRIGLRF